MTTLKIIAIALISIGAAILMLFASYESNIYTVDVRSNYDRK